MKYLIVIGDGMADDAVEALGGKTPLEAAQKPMMDRLAGEGELGTVRTVPKGLPPGSDTAILSIFGYDPRHFFTGRSPLEAAAVGIDLAAGDVSYRCNLVALSDEAVPYEEKTILSHSGGSVEGEEALALMEHLLADAGFAACAKKNDMVIHPAPMFRHVAVQTGVAIDGLVTTPPHDHLGEAAGPLLPRGAAVAEGLREMMAIAHRLLDNHPVNRARRAEGKLPVNGIWFWAEGRAMSLPPFYNAHKKRGLVVSAVPLVQGIAGLAGLDCAKVPGATGELDTNYEGKADAVLRGLLQEGYDFALLHVEAPDECTHNGDTPGKLEAIRRLDGRCLARLWSGLDASGQPFRLEIISDHKTLTATRGHNGDPVPYLIWDSRAANSQNGLRYTEADAEKGPFIEEGHSLISRLLEEPPV